MLILQGTLRATATLGGGTNKKTGEVIPVRDVIQLETVGRGGLMDMHTITVASGAAYADKVGQKVNIPVRAWAKDGRVAFVFDDEVGVSKPSAGAAAVAP